MRLIITTENTKNTEKNNINISKKLLPSVFSVVKNSASFFSSSVVNRLT